MLVFADLQIHSRFSRAVSKQMTLPFISDWAKTKGIGLVATGDWTHPMWFREIERDLEEIGNGLLKLRPQSPMPRPDTGISAEPLFLLATEVSSIYSQGGKGRRVHTLIWVPTLESARKIGQEMTRQGCNLLSDGRPIIPLTCIDIAELVLTIEPKALVIPAHAWTPWFSLYGSMSGFNSIDEAFGEYAKNIYAIETGLSSSPDMNWRIAELDNRNILSFSDAHSGAKIGREATAFEIPEDGLSYDAIYEAIAGVAKRPETKVLEKVKNNNHPKIAFTVEFYPEEGKYHFSGHRTCKIRLDPQESKTKGNTCPVCGKNFTQGVMQRVEQLAGRSEDSLELQSAKIRFEGLDSEVLMTSSRSFPGRAPFVRLVPLIEIIAECIGSPTGSPKTDRVYRQLVSTLGSEFNVLLTAKIDEITSIAGEKIATGVEKVRNGDLVIDPGYDGVFGVVKLWKDGEELVDRSKEQLSIF